MSMHSTHPTAAPRDPAWRPPRSTHPLTRARAQLSGAVQAIQDRAGDVVIGSALLAAVLELEEYVRDARSPEGALADAEAEAPRLRSAVKRIRAEAARLLRRLRTLSRRADIMHAAAGPMPVNELRRLSASLERLRERETLLLLDAQEELPALD